MKKIYSFEDTGRSGYAGGQRITNYVISECLKNNTNNKYIVIDRGYNLRFEREFKQKGILYIPLSKNKKYLSFLSWLFICIWHSFVIKSKDTIIYTPTRAASFAIGG